MKLNKASIFLIVMVIIACGLTIFKPNNKTVYLYPGYWGFNPGGKSDLYMYGSNLSKICRDKGLTLKVTRNLDNLIDVNKIIVFEVVGYNPDVLKKYPKSKISLFLWEPPTVLQSNYEKINHKNFSKVFTWNDSLVNNKKYCKFHYPELKQVVNETIPFSAKKLCALIAKNEASDHPLQLFSMRIDAIKFFQDQVGQDFDLYGQGWSQALFKSYKEQVANNEVLINYKFSICFENAKDIKGYISEKIFNSFRCLCVPIYLGADNITDYVPENCFIDRRKFKSNTELLDYLKNMEEEEYLTYQKNIKEFVSSPMAQKFSSENFKQAFLKALK